MENPTIFQKASGKFWALLSCKKQCTDESTTIDDIEITEERVFDADTQNQLEKAIKKANEILWYNHSNIVSISASHFKSKNYSSGILHKYEPCPCIAIYVSKKGEIPSGEQPFPDKIEGFSTDVREKNILKKAGKPPSTFHKSLKIGCEIGASDHTGTLGGFIYVNGEIMAITCAHVILTEKELEDAKKNGKILEKTCFQPAGKEKVPFGELKHVKYDDRFDVAIIRINPERMPTNGCFPEDTFAKDRMEVFPKVEFDSGEVIEPENLCVNARVFKYGAVTGFTRGKVTQVDCQVKISGSKMIGLVEVISASAGKPFSSPGDSGSMVFLEYSPGRPVAVGILVGGDARRDYVLPITDICKVVDMKMPYFLIPFNPQTRYLEKVIKNEK